MSVTPLDRSGPNATGVAACEIARPRPGAYGHGLLGDACPQSSGLPSDVCVGISVHGGAPQFRRLISRKERKENISPVLPWLV